MSSWLYNMVLLNMNTKRFGKRYSTVSSSKWYTPKNSQTSCLLLPRPAIYIAMPKEELNIGIG